MDARLFVLQPIISPVDLSDYAKISEVNPYCLLIPRETFENERIKIESLFKITINSQHVKDILNPEHPSFFDSTTDYEMVILRTISEVKRSDFAEGHPPELHFSESSFGFFCFSNLLIIVYEQDTQVLKQYEKMVLSKNKSLYKNPSELMYFSLNFLLDQFLLLRVPMNRQFKQWQRLMLGEESNFSLWNDLINYKNTLETITGLCEDIQETFEDWRRYTRYQMEQQFIINLNDLDEHIQRAVYMTEKLSDSIDTLIQLHFAALSHRNNEILRVLAIISAIFLPLTLITGVFGMNFENMPILKSKYAYDITIISMFLLGLVFIAFFKKKKWI
jgi:magnesium transporter